MKPFYWIIFMVCVSAVSCTTMKLSIPSDFSDQATKMKVKGVNGWPVNEHASFGNYKTTRIKRGWHSVSGRRKGDFFELNAEESMLRILGVTKNEVRTTEKDKFHFEIQHDSLSAEVYALERKVSNSTKIVTTRNDILKNLDLINYDNNREYKFAAMILPSTSPVDQPWSLVMSRYYDKRNDTARRLFDRPYEEEKGYVTNGIDSIFIKPIYVQKAESKSGKEGKMPWKIVSGYELRWDGGISCVVDAFGKYVWMYNELEPSEKLLLAAISTAILLRRIEDK